MEKHTKGTENETQGFMYEYMLITWQMCTFEHLQFVSDIIIEHIMEYISQNKNYGYP